MKLSQLAARDFDLEKTLQCGQVFHWEPCDAGFVGALETDAVYVEQRGDELSFAGATAKKIANYFSLDHPLGQICGTFPNDPAMIAARDFCQGLRIIRQPLWECLATFICSSMKQVAHIRQISLALRKRFGVQRTLSANHVYAFPNAERLAAASEDDLRACALGYRAKNLLTTARLVTNGEEDLETWRSLPDDELRARLCELPGVGAKVANCVMLFAYERLRAFPIDVWIERVLKEKYFAGKGKVTARKLRDFCDSYFGEHGGYAQQYLFHHARKGKPANRGSSSRNPGGAVVRPSNLRYNSRVKRRSRAVSQRRPRNDGR